MFGVLREVRAQLAGLAGTLDPDTVTVDDAARAIGELAAIEKAAAGMRLLLARRVDNASLFGRSGDRSAAEWLAKQTGRSTRDAQEELACSRRLRELPGAEDAVRNGELSSDQAKAVADGAAADPSAEDELLDTARRGSLGELERQAKARKAAALGDDEARRRAAHRKRGFAMGTNAQGEGWGRFNGPAEFVVRLKAQLKPWLDAEFARARTEGRRERPDAYAYDALRQMLGLADDEATARPDATARAEAPADDVPRADDGPRRRGSGSAATTQPGVSDPGAGSEPEATAADGSSVGGGRAPSEPPAGTDGNDDDTGAGRTARPAGDGPPPGPTPSPVPAPATPAGRGTDVRLILRVDAAALRRGHTEAGELCDVAGLGPVPLADLRRFLPQAAIDVVITNGVDVFNVTHLGRRTTARQQTVLDLLNIGCTRLGCNATEHLQVDHRVDWAHIHVTELANLDWLCPHDHRLKTHDGWQLEPGTGKRRLLPPDQQRWNHDHPGPDPPGDPPHRHAA
ncbi:MAG: HNH endonuclease [Microthrixaceae bacterium]|nr:HNH endonuclease [Microthrixaceae bacterium]